MRKEIIFVCDICGEQSCSGHEFPIITERKEISFSQMRKAYEQMMGNLPWDDGVPPSAREVRMRSRETDLCGAYTQIAFNMQAIRAQRLRKMRKFY